MDECIRALAFSTMMWIHPTHELAKVGLAIKNAMLPAAPSTGASEPGAEFQNVNYIRVASIVFIEGLLRMGLEWFCHIFQAVGCLSQYRACNRNDLWLCIDEFLWISNHLLSLLQFAITRCAQTIHILGKEKRWVEPIPNSWPMNQESLYLSPSFTQWFSYRALFRYPILSAADGFFRDDTNEGGVSAKSDPGCCSIFSRMACCSAARRRSFIICVVEESVAPRTSS